MHRRRFLQASTAATSLAIAGRAYAQQQEPVRIGVVLPFSGQFADLASQLDNGIKLYMAQKGDTVAGRKVEIIRKDSGGVAPDVATRLALELVTRDKADVLAGLMLSPNVIAISKVSAEAKKLAVIMNAATTAIIGMSPYCVRTSMTFQSVGSAAATWAYKSGVRKVYLMVSDFAPGKEIQGVFAGTFKKAGGEVYDPVFMPVANPDFSAFVQRAKDVNPEAIFIFVPGGAQPAALGKAFAERGVDAQKIKIIGTGEITDEASLRNMGDAALGLISVYHYDFNDDTPANKAFVAAYNAAFKRNPDFASVGGYDGMHVIYEALKKAGGKTDGDSLIAAARGMTIDGPRGAVQINAETRDIVQDIQVRKVRKVDGQLRNVVIDRIGR